MKHGIKNIIFEFTLTLYRENEIVFGISEDSEEIVLSKEVTAYGFIVGITENFRTKQIIFYN